MKHNRLTALLFIACVLAIASPALAKDKWINLRTKNFNIVSNAGERDTRELALKLEQFRYVFSKIFSAQPVESVPITVMAFKNDGSFKPFKPLYEGKPISAAGYFQAGRDENIIALRIVGPSSRPLAIIYHEYIHLLTSRTPRDWPLWLREGIAEVYSSFDIDKNKVTLGAPISNHVFLLREKKFIPLRELFEVNHHSPAYNERDKKSIFYAQSWALAHYFMLGDKTVRQPQLVQFLKLLYAGQNAEKAFLEAFKADFATVEKALQRYVRNDTYTVVEFKLESTETEVEMSLQPLGEAEARFYLGNLLLRINRLDDAETYLKQAHALDPELAGPHEGLGFLAMRRNNYAEAGERFKQAAERGSRNHLAHYYYAESLQRQALENIRDVKPETVETIIREAKEAIRLMPGFTPAYHLLGSFYLFKGEKLEEGAEILNKAIQMAPQEMRFRLTLAQIQIRLEDLAAAKKTLAPLLAAGVESSLKEPAESIMKMIDAYERPVAETSRPRTRDEDLESKEPASRPRLRRRNDAGQTTGESPSTDEEGPSLKFPDTNYASGVLAAIECEGGGMVLVVKTPDKLLRFAVTDVVNLSFYSKDPEMKLKIDCGPINLPVFIHFKPLPAGQSRMAGDAVAVEFKKQ